VCYTLDKFTVYCLISAILQLLSFSISKVIYWFSKCWWVEFGWLRSSKAWWNG